MRLVLGSLVALALLAPPSAEAQLRLSRVGGEFDSPVYAVSPPGDGRRLLVVEQGGTVRVVRDGQVLGEPFLTLSGDITTGGERGLLSIAFAPDYESSRLLYAYFTDGQGDIRVDELRRAADSRDRVEAGYRRTTIEVRHREAGNHNGGTVRFGPDGRLYLGTGDGGNGYDTPTRDALNTSSLLGKILRITPTSGGGYAVPPGNPFGAVWAYGLRNPYRFSFDRRTGDLAIGDVGQNRIEEVDWVPHVPGVGAGRGANFGWDECEGSLDAEPVTTDAPCPLAGDVRPLIEHEQSGGYSSVIGGVVVRDAGLEPLAGRYLYGDLSQSRMRSALLGPGGAGGDRPESALAVDLLVAVGEDACGRVYAVELGGRVARVEDGSPSACTARVPEPGAADTTAPRLRLRGRRRQRLTRRGLLVTVQCDERCRVRAFGRLSLRRGGKRIRLRQVKRVVAAGRAVRLRLKVSRGSRAAVRRALRRGRRVRATITVRARDDVGNLSSAKRLIKLRR